jgi:CheY-like chemotaxis protein
MREVSPNSVLLVDDDPSLRELLSMQLEEAGFKARQAEDGIDGLVKLRDELPKVIISDLQMPRMSGIEFISVVRRRFPFIPVIVLAGLIPNKLRAEAEPDAWFEKGGLNISELLRALHDLVRRTPDRVYLPQVVTTPVRTRPGFAGHITLTCPDCLRTFRATSTPENKAREATAVCIYCEARVPYEIESSTPSKATGAPSATR